MVEIRLLDEQWMEETINDLLRTGELITGFDKDICRETGYQEEMQRISQIESKSGYEYNAAYLNGIKKGFQLAMFLNRK